MATIIIITTIAVVATADRMETGRSPMMMMVIIIIIIIGLFTRSLLLLSGAAFVVGDLVERSGVTLHRMSSLTHSLTHSLTDQRPGCAQHTHQSIIHPIPSNPIHTSIHLRYSSFFASFRGSSSGISRAIIMMRAKPSQARHAARHNPQTPHLGSRPR